MSSIGQWTLDVRDVAGMARFWAAVLGYRIEAGGDGNAKLFPPDDAPPGVPTVWLQGTAGPKDGKNRLHPDLVVDGEVDDDFDDEVERLVGLGARRADVGQTGREEFVVLADPEGNEFCVLRRRPRVADPTLGAPEPLARLRAICLALPEVTERMSHGEPTWFVRKTFVTYADHHHDDRLAFWCAAPPGAQEALVAAHPEKFFRPPYVGVRGWLGIYLDVPVDWDEIAEQVQDAYREVAPKKLVARLDARG